MKAGHHKPLWFVLSCVLLLISCRKHITPDSSSPSEFEKANAILSIKVVQGLGTEKQMIYSAVEITSAMTAIKGESFKVNGKPLLYRMSDKIVVDRTFFSDIRRVEVTRFGRQDKVFEKICTVHFENLAMTEHELMRFLIESDAIQTYVHVEAESKLVKESHHENVYRAHFLASHTYFTTAKNVDTYRYVIQIDHSTGEVTVGSWQ